MGVRSVFVERPTTERYMNGIDHFLELLEKEALF